MTNNIYIYILIVSLVTYGLRVIPILLIKDEIKNNFIRSFLYYVPYVTLSIMTFPAIMNDSQPKTAGLLAMIIGSLVAWKTENLFKVAIACTGVVFITEYVLTNLV